MRGAFVDQGGLFSYISPEARVPPLRPERHIPNSIATMRRRLVVALVKALSRCPCCAAQIQRSPRRNRS